MNGLPPVVILLLNYNRLDDTMECLKSLEQCSYPVVHIVVIDNGSTDGSAERLRGVPNIELLATGKNLGYTGGINAGLRHVLSREYAYALILNNDTVVEPDFLEHLVRPMEQQVTAAAACGTVYCHHDPELVWYAGGRLIPWRGLAIHEAKDRRVPKSHLNGVREVSFVTGCMMLLRLSTLEAIGLQDERFFMYLDDIELSARIRRRGFKLLYVPRSVIYHKVLGEHESPFKLYYSVRNRFLVIHALPRLMDRIVASFYFFTVIAMKLLYWRLTNARFFHAALQGLRDFRKGNFGEGHGRVFAP